MVPYVLRFRVNIATHLAVAARHSLPDTFEPTHDHSSCRPAFVF
jgi:hypothetical protein